MSDAASADYPTLSRAIEAERDYPVDIAIREANQVEHALGETINELRGRLQPLVRPSDCEDVRGFPCVPEAPHSEIVRRLYTHNAALRGYDSDLRDLIERLDV